MEIINNYVIQGNNQRPILTDFFYKNNREQKPLVIFAHGYKGFKDWGCWNLVAEHFAKANFFFVKFNFSHNGGTVEQPIDFPDLEAFAENNYSKELDDLKSVIDWLTNESPFVEDIDLKNIILIGHSRGGGIVTIKASEDDRITKLITWAGVCDFGKRTATIGDLETWKKEGVKYVLNGRTKQLMPHNYQFYEDYLANEQRLSIKNAAENLAIPHLIIHGNADEAVNVKEALSLHKWNTKSELALINNANHTFGARHPWTERSLTVPLQKVVEKTIVFI